MARRNPRRRFKVRRIVLPVPNGVIGDGTEYPLKGPPVGFTGGKPQMLEFGREDILDGEVFGGRPVVRVEKGDGVHVVVGLGLAVEGGLGGEEADVFW